MSEQQTTKLASMLADIAASETFSVAAINRYNSLIKQVESMEKREADLNEKLEAAKREVIEKGRQITRLDSELSAFRYRESDIAEREKKIFDLEKQAAVNAAVADTWAKSCGLMFRNIEVRQSAFGTRPVAMDGYVSSSNFSSDVTSSAI